MTDDQVPGRPAIVKGWMTAVGIVSAIALAILVIWMAQPSGLIAAVALVVAMVALFVAWFASWTAVTTRVHLALLERPQLDDSQRVAWFTAVLLGYPVLSVAVVVLVYGIARTLTTS